jgi:cobyrinic acid a,c-diamide synthase
MTDFNLPRIVVAGTASGVGKTSFVVGLIRALRARGLKVAPFKCGPDYLDPTYHSRAAGTPSHNLDGWMMGREAVVETFVRGSRGADIAVIEGVMGLYDSASATSEEGSTAEIAKWLDAEVLLVVDARGMARSVGAIACGFAGFDPEVRIAGLICNRVGSKSHLRLLREASALPPVLGAMPKTGAESFPERHLGLRTASTDAVPEEIFSSWGEVVRDWCDLESILKGARRAPGLMTSADSDRSGTGPLCRIGIAFDEAFHFYYEDNLRRLEEAGAELIRFSPVHDGSLPSVDGLYLGGGYPEVHAKELAANESMRKGIRDFARQGGLVYAECGGLMYLCSALQTLEGSRYPMCDVLPGETTMHDRLQALGYVEVQTVDESILGDAGVAFRGHQFRYSTMKIEPHAIDQIYSITRRLTGATFAEGFVMNRVLGSYVHAHWGSNPRIPTALVNACARNRDGASREAEEHHDPNEQRPSCRQRG